MTHVRLTITGETAQGSFLGCFLKDLGSPACFGLLGVDCSWEAAGQGWIPSRKMTEQPDPGFTI